MRSRGQTGTTLIELIISIVVISIAVTGVLLAYTNSIRASADPVLAEQAVIIAEAYLEEISLRPFADPDTAVVCGPPEASRNLYDDVCDYNGLVDTGARDQTGAAVAGLERYTVSIGVQNSVLHTVAAADALLIEVRVRHQSAPEIDLTLSGYRTN